MEGIVISTVRYGESQVVTQILTDSDGRQSYIAKANRSHRQDGVAAALQPLTIVSFEASHAKSGSMARASQLHIAEPFVRIPFDNVRRSIAIFLAELLNKSIPREVPDPDMFVFVKYWLLMLDSDLPGVYNLHLVFMMRLATMLGFGPSPDRDGCPFFDLQSGEWTPTLPSHRQFLCDHYADVWLAILNADDSDLSPVCTTLADRRAMLSALEDFFRLHHPGFGELVSLRVLMGR